MEGGEEHKAQLLYVQGLPRHCFTASGSELFVSDGGSPCCKHSDPNKREGGGGGGVSGGGGGGGEAALLLTQLHQESHITPFPPCLTSFTASPEMTHDLLKFRISLHLFSKGLIIRPHAEQTFMQNKY